MPFLLVTCFNQALSCVLCCQWIPFNSHSWLLSFSIESLQVDHCGANWRQYYCLVTAFQLEIARLFPTICPLSLWSLCSLPNVFESFFRITFKAVQKNLTWKEECDHLIILIGDIFPRFTLRGWYHGRSTPRIISRGFCSGTNRSQSALVLRFWAASLTQTH